MSELGDVRAFVLERDEGICQYCGGPADQIDHIFNRFDRRRLGIADDDASWIVAACAKENMPKYTLHRVPESWRDRIPELNGMTPLHPWKVYGE